MIIWPDKVWIAEFIFAGAIIVFIGTWGWWFFSKYGRPQMGPTTLIILGVIFLSSGICWHYYNAKHIATPSPSASSMEKEQKVELTKEQQQLINILIKEYEETHPTSQRTAQLAQDWVNNKLKEHGQHIKIKLLDRQKATGLIIEDSKETKVTVGVIEGCDQGVSIYRSEDTDVKVGTIVGPKHRETP